MARNASPTRTRHDHLQLSPPAPSNVIAGPRGFDDIMKTTTSGILSEHPQRPSWNCVTRIGEEITEIRAT
jgi:hypothetical protein